MVERISFCSQKKSVKETAWLHTLIHFKMLRQIRVLLLVFYILKLEILCTICPKLNCKTWLNLHVITWRSK
jgi:hypothetical protein